MRALFYVLAKTRRRFRGGFLGRGAAPGWVEYLIGGEARSPANFEGGRPNGPRPPPPAWPRPTRPPSPAGPWCGRPPQDPSVGPPRPERVWPGP